MSKISFAIKSSLTVQRKGCMVMLLATGTGRELSIMQNEEGILVPGKYYQLVASCCIKKLLKMVD